MRRLLVIDSNVSHSSPAMRGWLRAAGTVLPRHFDEVEVWGFRCELTAPWLKFRPMKPVTGRWAVQSLFYEWSVRKMIAGLSPEYRAETLIQSTGTHLPVTDIRYIHFWHTAYAEAAAARPESLRLPLKDRLMGRKLIKEEANALRLENTQGWWCVSKGIAAPILRDGPAGMRISYLPNAYNEERFNHSVRHTWQIRMRDHYGFGPEEMVLAFSAFGHFERKGLRQAVQAVARLRAAGHPVKLLVLGGDASSIQKFKGTLAESPRSLEGIHFAGLVQDMEKHLAAADAFFMPSHFEAFSLAEIEAAALGLRLYLTAHPGHEMILAEHTNGRLLPWSPDGMADILEEEIKGGVIRQSHHHQGQALTTPQFAAALSDLYQQAVSRKWPSPMAAENGGGNLH